jgi:DeoR/GlpR family transcriptional regulator of sugar metabolism
MNPTRYSEEIERSMCAFYASLAERDRRHYAAIEAVKMGHGGITYMADLFRCSERTVRRGMDQLGQPPLLPAGGSRHKGGAVSPVSKA